jgi:hypothetical protein
MNRADSRSPRHRCAAPVHWNPRSWRASWTDWGFVAEGVSALETVVYRLSKR